MNRHHAITKTAQIITDFLLINAAVALAYFIRIGFYVSSDFPFAPYMQTGFALSFVWIFLLFFARAYKYDQDIMSIRHLQRVAYASIIGVSLFLISYFFLREMFFSRLIVVYMFLFATTLIMLSHIGFYLLQRHLYKKGLGTIKTLVIGTNRKAKDTIARLQKKHSRFQVVAVLDAYGSKEQSIANVPVLGKLDKFEKTINTCDIEHIIQVDNIEQTLNILNYAVQHNI